MVGEGVYANPLPVCPSGGVNNIRVESGKGSSALTEAVERVETDVEFRKKPIDAPIDCSRECPGDPVHSVEIRR